MLRSRVRLCGGTFVVRLQNTMSPNVEELVSQAHDAWELFEFEQAAELFEAAAVAEKRAAATRGPFALADQSFSHRLRAAVCRWDLGRFEDARDTLRESLTFDWKAARLWSDRHVGEMAFCRFLMEKAAAGDREGFIELWKTATARGEELSLSFPFAIPHQKQLIRACTTLGFIEGSKQVLGRIDPKRLKSDHELQMLAAQVARE